MSRNNITFFILSCLMIIPLWGAVSSETILASNSVEQTTEDSLIIKAIIGEEYGDFTKSRDTYEKLFALTGNKEYLIYEAQDALMQKKNFSRSISNLTHWMAQYPADYDRELYLILATLYVQSGALQEADKIVDAYLTNGDTSAENLQEFGLLKTELGKNKEALRLYQRAYKLSHDEELVMQIASLYILKFKREDKAIEILQKHLDIDPSASIGLYFKLIELYAKKYRLDKVLKLYKDLYQKKSQKYFLQKIIEISFYQKDTDGLIAFLEKTHGNENLLYNTYKSNNLFDKAFTLARKMYTKTNKPKWIAEEAMLLYEQAQMTHVVTPELLKEVEHLFDDAIQKGVSKGIYLNYYGYTLIDHDLDIDKGISLVRRALGEDHNNIFYIDSLAWGLYKKGQCRKAYKLMLRVVKIAGIEEQEIKDHFKAIKACNSRKKRKK